MTAFHRFSPVLPSRFIQYSTFHPHHFLLLSASTMSRPGKRNKLATRFGGKPGRHVTCKAAQGDFHFCYRHLGHIPPMTVESGDPPQHGPLPPCLPGLPSTASRAFLGLPQHPPSLGPALVSARAAHPGASSQLCISWSHKGQVLHSTKRMSHQFLGSHPSVSQFLICSGGNPICS